MEQIGLVAIMDTAKFDRGVSKYMQNLTKMQQATDKLVRGSVTVKDAEGNMIKYSTSTAMAGAATQKASMSVGEMVTKMAALAAAYGVVTKAQEFAVESFNAARAQNDIKGALVGVVGGLDQYNKLIEAARGSTRGMVSETNLANAGMVLLKSGIAGSAEEVGRLSAAGTALVNTYSAQGASQEKLVRFLLTGNRALMDNFNITAQQIAQMQAQIEATTGLTGQEAKLAAIKALVIQEGEKLLGSVSAETIQVGQATAAWADFTAAFGQVLIAFNQATGLLPSVTGLFQDLTAGAQAWTYTLNEAIPAIQAHYASLGQQAAQAAIAAQSQDELVAAFENGLSDLDAFKQELVANVDSVEEYNSIIYKGSRGSKIFTDQLSLTGKQFADMKMSAQATAVVVEKTVDATVNETVALQDSSSALQDVIMANQSLNKWLGEVNRRREESIALQAADAAYARNLAAMGEAERQGYLASYQDKVAAAQEQKQASESANKSMTKSFDKAADQLRSTIESVIKPSLSEVWQPAGEEGNIDEWARRVATVATSGFSSEWLNQAAAQFGGQSFFQPIMDAMQGGDEGALKAAANDLLTRNVTALWDVETIKARVRQQLQEQNLRQQIIDQVQAELSAEGVNVSPEAVAAVAGGASQAAGGMAQANQATADMGTTAGATQTALDNLALSLDTISNVKIVVLITKTGELQTAIGKLSVGVTTASEEMITALTAAVPKMQDVIKLADWVSLGKSIDEGIVKGIRGNEHLVYEKLKAMAVEALKQAGDAIGYGSPAAKFVPLGASIPEGVELGMMSNSGLVQKAYDKLFNIDRSTTSLDKILHQSRYKLTSFGKGQLSMGEEKVTYVLNTIQKDFTNNASKILNAVNPMAAFQEFVSSHEWRKANIKDRDATAIAQRFYQNFLKESAKAQAALQKIIVEGSRKAIDLAGSLSDVATAGAQQLNGEIDMLAQLLNTGASEFMLDGQIYSAAEATDLLNQKMQEQASIQDDLLQLQQSQNQLNFLEKQLGLIETISKAGLNPADVLGGADLSTVSGLVAASQNAIASIIGQVSSDIGAYTPVQGSQTINNRAVNLNMGGVNISNGMSLNNLTSLIQRTVANGFG